MNKFLILLLIIQTSILSAYEVHVWDGKNYQENSESQKRTAEFILEKFKFDGNEEILDLGCGDGKISAQLSRFVPKGHTLGIDLSKNMIDFATQTFPVSEYHNLDFSTGDACKLAYENSFDLIFSFTALQWAQDHKEVLLGMHNALKSGGTIALSMPMGFPLTIDQALDEMASKEKWRAFFVDFSSGFNFVTLENYQSLLVQSGFEINLIEKIPQKDLFESKEVLRKFILQWLPHLRVIPQDLKASFMDEFIDRYMELEGIEEDDSVYFFPTHLTVIAHKI